MNTGFHAPTRLHVALHCIALHTVERRTYFFFPLKVCFDGNLKCSRRLWRPCSFLSQINPELPSRPLRYPAKSQNCPRASFLPHAHCSLWIWDVNAPARRRLAAWWGYYGPIRGADEAVRAITNSAPPRPSCCRAAGPRASWQVIDQPHCKMAWEEARARQLKSIHTSTQKYPEVFNHMYPQVTQLALRGI